MAARVISIVTERVAADAAPLKRGIDDATGLLVVRTSAMLELDGFNTAGPL